MRRAEQSRNALVDYLSRPLPKVGPLKTFSCCANEGSEITGNISHGHPRKSWLGGFRLPDSGGYYNRNRRITNRWTGVRGASSIAHADHSRDQIQFHKRSAENRV